MQEKLDDFISSSCEVKSLSNQLIVIGYICKSGDDYLEISSKKDKLPMQKANSRVKIIIKSKKNGWKTLIGKVYLSTNDMMRITDLQTSANFERRKYFRVNLQLDSEAVKSTDMESEDMIDEHTAAIPIKIKDASLRGLQFESDISFEINDELIILIPVLTKDLYFTATICRKFKKNGAIGYGCEFIDPPDRDLDILYKYLLEQELNEIRSRLNDE